MDLTAVILAGGRGTRLSSVVSDLPKPMAPVLGRPFLEYQLRHLKAQGFSCVVLCVGYMAQSIQAYFGDGSALGLEISYAFEEEPLGTGGALRNALPFIGETALMLNGDTYQPLPMDRLWSAHQERRADLTLVVTPVDAAGDYGSITLAEDGRLLRFDEKIRGSGYVNAGCMVVSRELIAGIPPARAWSLEQTWLPGWIEEGRRCYGWGTDVQFFDIGTPARYQLFQEEMARLGN